MENERKSVFERLGTIRSPSSAANSARSLSHELNHDDLRHRVVHLSKRRSHQQTQIAPSMHYHQHNLPMKRSKLNVPEPPPPPPTKQTTNVRKRRKKPKVINQEALDEGEIVDDEDEDEYEEYDEEEDEEEEGEVEEEKEEGEIDFKKSTRTRRSTSNTQKDISSLHVDGENTHHQKNGRTAQAKSQQQLVKVKSELNDSQIIRIKEEIFDDDDNRLQQSTRVGSDYSEWSDGEDDELLVLENNNQKMNKGAMITTNMNGERTVMIKEELEDSFTSVRNFEDLEAISEDELDPLSDDFFGKSQADMDDLLNKSDSLSQFPENGNTANSTDACGNLKVLDILEIDWKSLITEKPSADSAEGEGSLSDEAKDSHAEFRHRNSTIFLLNRIGFSHELAGPQLSTFIQSQLADKLKDQYIPMTHKLPALHCYYRDKQELREGFFKGTHYHQHQQPPSCSSSSAETPALSPLNGAKIEAFGRMAI